MEIKIFQGKKKIMEKEVLQIQKQELNLNIKRMTRRNMIDELLKHWNNLKKHRILLYQKHLH